MKFDPKTRNYPLSREQRVFLSVWFNMTHAHSLDSHRARTMHGLNALEELIRLIRYAHARPEDRAMVACEAATILETEVVLQRPCFAAPTKAMLTVLRRSYGVGADKVAAERSAALLDSHLREYTALLNQQYVHELFDGLRAALAEPDLRSEPVRFDEIRSLCGTLLSYLLARGHSLEALFQLYRQLLVPANVSGEPYEFERRFDLLRRIVTSPITAWRAYFAIDGITDVAAFPEKIGDIRFLLELPRELAGLPNTKRRPRRLFATGENRAIDPRAAGQQLHEQINRVLDLVRFEYDQANITVSDDFAVGRSSGDRWRVLPIPKVVPNPRAPVSREELHQFASHVSRLVTSDRFSQEGRDRVLSAFRLYRTGADTTIFENKLVNWWTALESLSKGAGGASKIAEAVQTSVAPVLIGVSIANDLVAFRDVLLEHSIELVDPASHEPIALKQLSLAQLYDVLGHAEHRQIVAERLRASPFEQMHIDQFLGRLAQPAEMGRFVKCAEERLNWHLQRIWRARCDIVHSAARMVNIALLCASLEAYLKSVLTALLAAFGRIPTLASPQEFFIRADHSYASARDALARGDSRGLKIFLTELRPQ
jgi:hypothetical protein